MSNGNYYGGGSGRYSGYGGSGKKNSYSGGAAGNNYRSDDYSRRGNPNNSSGNIPSGPINNANSTSNLSYNQRDRSYYSYRDRTLNSSYSRYDSYPGTNSGYKERDRERDRDRDRGYKKESGSSRAYFASGSVENSGPPPGRNRNYDRYEPSASRTVKRPRLEKDRVERQSFVNKDDEKRDSKDEVYSEDKNTRKFDERSTYSRKNSDSKPLDRYRPSFSPSPESEHSEMSKLTISAEEGLEKDRIRAKIDNKVTSDTKDDELKLFLPGKQTEFGASNSNVVDSSDDKKAPKIEEKTTEKTDISPQSEKSSKSEPLDTSDKSEPLNKGNEILESNFGDVLPKTDEEDLKFDGKEPIIEKQTPPNDLDEDDDKNEALTIANSSVLSSVTDSVDDAYFEHMDTIDEKNDTSEIINEADSNDSEVSEAETVITNSPPRVNKAKRLVRKLEIDKERRKLMRRGISRYDEEDEDEEHVAKDAEIELKLDEDDSEEEAKTPRDDRREKKEKTRSPGTSDVKRPYKLKRDSTGRSLLQRACGKGSLREVKDYIERGADPNESDYCGFTCLHEAALEGQADVVEYLISQGADVNKQALPAGDLETPLIDAAENIHLETVKVLLKNGADPRIYNVDGFTALTKIYNDHEGDEDYQPIIDVLEKANLEYVEEDGKVEGQVHGILEDPNDNYFSELIKRKGHSNNIFKFAAEGQKELTANFFVEGGQLETRPDVLILAARNGHLELVDIILGLNSGPFDINQTNSCGLSALLATVGRGHLDVVKFLLSRGADPFMSRKQDGFNCLEVAERAIHFDPKEVRVLREKMGLASKSDEKLGSPLEEKKLESKGKETAKINSTIVPEDSRASEKSSTKSNNKDTKSRAQTEDNKRKPEPETERRSKKSRPELPKVEPLPSNVFQRDKTPEPSTELHRIKSRENTLSPRTEDRRRPSLDLNKSPSPAPQLSKEQELQKVKSAEEAKLWQEKVEAKKRARKDMFLKAEKEKEKRRLEEKKLRLEQEQETIRAQKAEEEKKVKEEVAKVKELDLKRQTLEKQMIIETYPIGLRQAKFGVELTVADTNQFKPFYKFSIGGEDYVIDLQVALLTGLSIWSLTKDLAESDRVAITSIDKLKLWSLFYPMIGIDKSKPFSSNAELANDGHKRFQNLLFLFVKLEKIATVLKEKYPAQYELAWGNFTTVDLAGLSEYVEATKTIQDIHAQEEDEITIEKSDFLQKHFVPPLLRNRIDVLKTLQGAFDPLW